MKLRYNVEYVEMEDEIICVPIGEGASHVHGILKINSEGKEILEMLTAETSREKVITELSASYENDPKSLSEYVDKVLDTLRSANLLDD